MTELLQKKKIKYFQIDYKLTKYDTDNLSQIGELDEQKLHEINQFYKQEFEQIQKNIDNYDLLEEIELDFKQIKHNTCLLISQNFNWKFRIVFQYSGYVLNIANKYLDDIIFNQANAKKQLLQENSELQNFQLRLVRLKSQIGDQRQRYGPFILMHFLSIDELKKQQNIYQIDSQNEGNSQSCQIITREDMQTNQNKKLQIDIDSFEVQNLFFFEEKLQDKKNVQIEKQQNLSNISINQSQQKVYNNNNNSLGDLQYSKNNMNQSKESQYQIQNKSQQNDQIQIQHNKVLEDILDQIEQVHSKNEQRQKQNIPINQTYNSFHIQQGIEKMLMDIEELQNSYQQQLEQKQVQSNESILKQNKQVNTSNPQQYIYSPQNQLFQKNEKQCVKQSNNKQLIDLTLLEEEDIEEKNKDQQFINPVKINQKVIIQNEKPFTKPIIVSQDQVYQKQIQKLDQENILLKSQLIDSEYQLRLKSIQEAKLQLKIFLLKNPDRQHKYHEEEISNCIVIE